MLTRNIIIAVVFALCVAATPSSAQCYTFDGFEIPGTCCTPIPASGVNLPFFPGFTLPMEGACFRDCGVEAVFPGSLVLSPMITIFCDLFAIPFDINGTVDIAPTLMVAKYARNWVEFDAAGLGREVFRFLVNADVVYVTNTATPCPVPACAGAGLPVHLVGSVDYARDCSNPNSWQVIVNLTHHCGDMAHGAFSARPTTVFGHPDRTFAFVAPAPFNFAAPGPVPHGMAVGETVRVTNANLINGTWTCYSELPVTAGFSLNAGNFCPCGTNGAPRWEAVQYRLEYGCFSPGSEVFQPLPWAPLAPTGLSAFPLGSFSQPPGSFASNKSLSVYFGVSQGTDPCANNFPFHFVNGVGTTGGNGAFVPSSPVVTDRLVDLSNTMVFINSPPFLFTTYGAAYLPTMVWSASFI